MHVTMLVELFGRGLVVHAYLLPTSLVIFLHNLLHQFIFAITFSINSSSFLITHAIRILSHDFFPSVAL